MKTFNYHSAKDVKEASKLSSSNSAYLAGGMTTLPSMKLGLASYKDLINLKNIKNLSGIKVSSKTVRIGATTKHVEVAQSKDVRKAIPSLSALAEGIGDPQVRNRGTIGGSVANNDPAADYPSACIALNAVIHTNSRKIEANKFFKGMFETALKSGEIIEAIEFEIPEKSNYQKFPNPASRYAIVGVYIAECKSGINVAEGGLSIGEGLANIGRDIVGGAQAYVDPFQGADFNPFSADFGTIDAARTGGGTITENDTDFASGFDSLVPPATEPIN